MKLSIIPDGTGLPELLLPRQYPKNPFQRVLLSWVLTELGKRTDGHLSRREVQEVFNRAGGQITSKHLAQLVKNGWISVRKSSKGMSSTHYTFGKRLKPKSANTAAAHDLASKLFKKSNGLLSSLISSPAIGTNFLGTNGIIIAGVLLRSSRGLTPLEIYRYVPMFMVRTTVDNCLKKLLNAELVEKQGKFWSIAPNFSLALTKYEAESGAISRLERSRRRFKIERERQGIRVKSGKLTHAEETELKKDKCVCCDKKGGKMQIEHFPPRHWGGFDHIDLCWGIHAKCNLRYSNKIKKYPEPPLDKFIQMTLNENVDIRLVVVAILEISIKRFYKAFDENRDEDARQIVTHAASVWHAIIGRDIPIKVKRLHNGKFKSNNFVSSGRSVRKSTGEIGKRFKSSELIRGWPDGPARYSLTKYSLEDSFRPPVEVG